MIVVVVGWVGGAIVVAMATYLKSKTLRMIVPILAEKKRKKNEIC